MPGVMASAWSSPLAVVLLETVPSVESDVAGEAPEGDSPPQAIPAASRAASAPTFNGDDVVAFWNPHRDSFGLRLRLQAAQTVEQLMPKRQLTPFT